MNLILKNARIIDPGRNIDTVGDIGAENAVIADPGKVSNAKVIDLKGKVLTPGFIDIHVHLRQPGNTTADDKNIRVQIPLQQGEPGHLYPLMPDCIH